MANEKRLIDLDATLKRLEKESFWIDPVKSCIRMFLSKAKLVDAVEVVRCKDCKYWLKAKEFSPFGWCLQRVNDLAYVSYKDRMEPEDFCSKGERKDNEN